MFPLCYQSPPDDGYDVPFEAWRPLYGPGAHPWYPWWRWDGHVWRDVRVGGAWGYTEEDLLPAWQWVAERLYRANRDHAVPAPEAMPGQVWALPSGWEFEVGPVRRWAGRAAQVTLNGRTIVLWRWVEGKGLLRSEDEVWPPPGAVLVAGPSMYGRDVPWAPADWRPAAVAR